MSGDGPLVYLAHSFSLLVFLEIFSASFVYFHQEGLCSLFSQETRWNNSNDNLLLSNIQLPVFNPEDTWELLLVSFIDCVCAPKSFVHRQLISSTQGLVIPFLTLSAPCFRIKALISSILKYYRNETFQHLAEKVRFCLAFVPIVHGASHLVLQCWHGQLWQREAFVIIYLIMKTSHEQD